MCRRCLRTLTPYAPAAADKRAARPGTALKRHTTAFTLDRRASSDSTQRCTQVTNDCDLDHHGPHSTPARAQSESRRLSCTRLLACRAKRYYAAAPLLQIAPARPRRSCEKPKALRICCPEPPSPQSPILPRCHAAHLSPRAQHRPLHLLTAARRRPRAAADQGSRTRITTSNPNQTTRR